MMLLLSLLLQFPEQGFRCCLGPFIRSSLVQQVGTYVHMTAAGWCGGLWRALDDMRSAVPAVCEAVSVLSAARSE